jgi:hypothetical protein
MALRGTWLISDFKKVETRVLILELLDFVDDVVDELGSRDQIVMCIRY